MGWDVFRWEHLSVQTLSDDDKAVQVEATTWLCISAPFPIVNFAVLRHAYFNQLRTRQHTRDFIISHGNFIFLGEGLHALAESVVDIRWRVHECEYPIAFINQISPQISRIYSPIEQSFLKSRWLNRQTSQIVIINRIGVRSSIGKEGFVWDRR